MRLLRLHLQAFGPFTGRIVDLAQGGDRLALIYGPNEARKSATKRAICDLRFGVPQLSTLDGWWEEGYTGRNGWAIPKAASCQLPVQRRRASSRI